MTRRPARHPGQLAAGRLPRDLPPAPAASPRGSGDDAQTVTASCCPRSRRPAPSRRRPTTPGAVVEATRRARRGGRTLTLEQEAGPGWEEAGTAETVRRTARADFVVEDADAEYRVVAAASGDLAATTSEPVEASRSVGAWTSTTSSTATSSTRHLGPPRRGVQPRRPARLLQGLRPTPSRSAAATLRLERDQGPGAPRRDVRGEEAQRQAAGTVRLPAQRPHRQRPALPVRRDRGADQVPARAGPARLVLAPGHPIAEERRRRRGGGRRDRHRRVLRRRRRRPARELHLLPDRGRDR